MPPAFRLLHTDDLRARIESERLDASQREFDRHNRVRLATAQILSDVARRLQGMCDSPFSPDPKELRAITGTVDGVLELLRGDWIRSPQQMAHERKG